MSRTIIVITVSLPLVLIVGAMAEEAYEVKGPDETAAMETSLRRRLGVYVCGIWPRPEILAGGLCGDKLSQKDVQQLQTWLRRIVRKEYQPEKMDPNQWYGIRKLHFGQDYIIGQSSMPAEDVVLQFQANGVGLRITSISQKIFPKGVDGITDANIIEAITSLVNYPQDMIQSIILEKKIEQMGEAGKEISVCYGRLLSGGHNPNKPPVKPRPDAKVENLPTWCNHMTFWATKGKLFISTTMVNWETIPATTAPLQFRLDNVERPRK